jgi:hypothetical protein
VTQLSMLPSLRLMSSTNTKVVSAQARHPVVVYAHASVRRCKLTPQTHLQLTRSCPKPGFGALLNAPAQSIGAGFQTCTDRTLSQHRVTCMHVGEARVQNTLTGWAACMLVHANAEQHSTGCC